MVFGIQRTLLCREGAPISVRRATRITKTAKQPKSPRGLSCALRRIAPQLPMIGIDVKFDRIDNVRMIAISLTNIFGLDGRSPPEFRTGQHGFE